MMGDEGSMRIRRRRPTISDDSNRRHLSVVPVVDAQIARDPRTGIRIRTRRRVAPVAVGTSALSAGFEALVRWMVRRELDSWCKQANDRA